MRSAGISLEGWKNGEVPTHVHGNLNRTCRNWHQLVSLSVPMAYRRGRILDKHYASGYSATSCIGF